MKTKNKLSRLNYLDVAKGLAIILVLIGHYPKTDSGIVTWLSSFHMPLFFLITGMLIKYTKEPERKMAELMRKKARMILLPYVTFSAIVIMLRSAYGFYKTAEFSQTDLMEDVMQTVTFSGISVLWFLPVLFFAQLLFIYVIKFWGRNITYITAVVFLFVSMAGNRLYQGYFGETKLSFEKALSELILVLLRILLAYVLITAGYVFQTYFKQKKIFSFTELFITFLLFLFGIAIAVSNTRVDMRTMVLGNEGFFLIGALVSSAAVILLCRNFDVFSYPLKNVFSSIGKNSLVIMATHVDFFVMLVALKGSEFVKTKNPVIQIIMETICVIIIIGALEMVIIYLYNHYLYFLLGRNKPRKKFKVISSNK